MSISHADLHRAHVHHFVLHLRARRTHTTQRLNRNQLHHDNNRALIKTAQEWLTNAPPHYANREPGKNFAGSSLTYIQNCWCNTTLVNNKDMNSHKESCRRIDPTNLCINFPCVDLATNRFVTLELDIATYESKYWNTLSECSRKYYHRHMHLLPNFQKQPKYLILISQTEKPNLCSMSYGRNLCMSKNRRAFQHYSAQTTHD